MIGGVCWAIDAKHAPMNAQFACGKNHRNGDQPFGAILLGVFCRKSEID
jgi:hypothetical protein